MISIDASNLPRFMQCNGHLLLQADPAYSSPDVTIREEGNAAHWLASVVFSGQHTLEELVDRKAPNGVFITPEMVEHVSDYLSCTDRSPRQICEMEWAYTLEGENFRIAGRADHIAQDGNLLNIDDFKYGYTIVEPYLNWTLISHAIGWISRAAVRPDWITFTIHQPRAPHRDGRTRSVTISYDELYKHWVTLSNALNNPSNIIQTGPHCYKCPSFVGCVARQDAECNAVEVAHHAYTAEISNDDLAARMIEIERADSLLKQSKRAYEEIALHRIKKGEIIEGFAAESELTNRQFKDFVTPELLQAMIGNDHCERKLPTPKKLEDAGVSKEFVASISERRNKGVKLVKVSADKRARKIFGNKAT